MSENNLPDDFGLSNVTHPKYLFPNASHTLFCFLFLQQVVHLLSSKSFPEAHHSGKRKRIDNCELIFSKNEIQTKLFNNKLYV